MEDKIREMHLIVLTRESKKLDMELENLLLEKEKLQLEIKKIKVKLMGGKVAISQMEVSFGVVIFPRGVPSLGYVHLKHVVNECQRCELLLWGVRVCFPGNLQSENNWKCVKF